MSCSIHSSINDRANDLALKLPSDFKSLKNLKLLKSGICFGLILPLIIFWPLIASPCQLSVSLLSGEFIGSILSFCLRK